MNVRVPTKGSVATLNAKAEKDSLSSNFLSIFSLELGLVPVIEAISRGCVAVTGKMDYIDNNYDDYPIVRTTSLGLYDDLISLLNNRKLLKSYAVKSMEFYNKFHTYRASGEYYKKELKLV